MIIKTIRLLYFGTKKTIGLDKVLRECYLEIKMWSKFISWIKNFWKKIISDTNQADSWAKKQIVDMARLGGKLVL